MIISDSIEELVANIRTAYRLGQRVSDDELDNLVHELGADVDEHLHPWRGRLPAFYAHDTIFLRPGLPMSDRRWWVPHELFHHLRHGTNQLAVPLATQARSERGAELFAGYFHLYLANLGRAPWEIAEHYTLPEDRVREWLRLVEGGSISGRWSA